MFLRKIHIRHLHFIVDDGASSKALSFKINFYCLLSFSFYNSLFNILNLNRDKYWAKFSCLSLPYMNVYYLCSNPRIKLSAFILLKLSSFFIINTIFYLNFERKLPEKYEIINIWSIWNYYNLQRGFNKAKLCRIE